MRFSIDSCYTPPPGNPSRLYPLRAQMTNAMEILWYLERALGGLEKAVEIVKLRWAFVGGQVKLTAVFEVVVVITRKETVQLEHSCMENIDGAVESLYNGIRAVVEGQTRKLSREAKDWQILLGNQPD
jgi:hypothetical protein